MIKQYEINSDIECFTAPDTVEADIESLRAKIAEWAKILKAAGLDYGVAWHCGLPYAFLDGDGNEYGEEQDVICETTPVHWEGAHLKVWADGDAQLFWFVKHTDDKVWAELPLKEEEGDDAQ